MKKVTLDQVERLSRGKRSGGNIGSRAIGHYLRPFERTTYQRALHKGYLEITNKDRPNLWHIWEKACYAKGWDCHILVKHTHIDRGDVYLNNQLIKQLNLKAAKELVKSNTSHRQP